MCLNVSVVELCLYVSECVCSKIIKELPGLVDSGTPCTKTCCKPSYLFQNMIQRYVVIIFQILHAFFLNTDEIHSFSFHIFTSMNTFSLNNC